MPRGKATTPAVELDFSALTVSDATDDKLSRESKGSKFDNSPVKDWLSASYEADQVKQVPVPTPAHAKALETTLRGVAARLKIGVQVVVKPADPKKPQGAQVVKFLGKPKRAFDAEKAAAKRAAKAAEKAAAEAAQSTQAAS